jgi:hypothetical protein
VNRQDYDLRPASGAPFANTGTQPGLAANGALLVPAYQYMHVASTQARRVAGGAIDIGAYESISP